MKLTLNLGLRSVNTTPLAITAALANEYDLSCWSQPAAGFQCPSICISQAALRDKTSKNHCEKFA